MGQGARGLLGGGARGPQRLAPGGREGVEGSCGRERLELSCRQAHPPGQIRDRGERALLLTGLDDALGDGLADAAHLVQAQPDRGAAVCGIALDLGPRRP